MATDHQYAGDPLAGLQEIPLPEPAPYLPQTVGWAVVGGALLLALIYVSWRVMRHRRANAYRREALAELAAIERRVSAPLLASPRYAEGGENPTPPSAQRGEVGWGALPALLKRTAIAATSREHVASLTGDEWLRFLDRSLGSSDFNEGPGRLLMRIAYATSVPEDISRDQLESLIALSRRWIKHHHADV